MAMCESTGTCEFIDRIKITMPTSANLYTHLYCEENPEKCARYMVKQALGDDYVPYDLFPHQRDKAVQFISQPNVLHCYR